MLTRSKSPGALGFLLTRAWDTMPMMQTQLTIPIMISSTAEIAAMVPVILIVPIAIHNE